MTAAVLFFLVFGAVIIVAVVLGIRGPSPKEKYEAARAYADWLTYNHPEYTASFLASRRLRELSSKGYRPTKKDAEEMLLATYVIQGWHNWNGAQV